MSALILYPRSTQRWQVATRDAGSNPTKGDVARALVRWFSRLPLSREGVGHNVDALSIGLISGAPLALPAPAQVFPSQQEGNAPQSFAVLEFYYNGPAAIQIDNHAPGATVVAAYAPTSAPPAGDPLPLVGDETGPAWSSLVTGFQVSDVLPKKSSILRALPWAAFAGALYWMLRGQK